MTFDALCIAFGGTGGFAIGGSLLCKIMIDKSWKHRYNAIDKSRANTLDMKEDPIMSKITVIGAGSVVTHDIPSNTLAYGNPCQVIRKLK